MKKSVIVVSLLTLLSGCVTSAGRIGELPHVANKDTAGNVVVIRTSNFVGAANSYLVAFNGRDVVGIGSGEHTNFAVPAGEHQISVKCYGGWSSSWKEETLKFSAKAAQSNYFEISPNMNCAGIQAIDEANAKSQMANSSFVNLEKSGSQK